MTDNTPVASFAERWRLIRQVARDAGRATEGMESALHLMVNINDDRNAAVVDKIRAYVEVGCTTPILRFASWDQKTQLTRALAEVMPAALALRLPA